MLLLVHVRLTWLCNGSIYVGVAVKARGRAGCSGFCAFLLIVSSDRGGPCVPSQRAGYRAFPVPTIVFESPHQHSPQRLQLPAEWLLCDCVVSELYNALNFK
jgi:hypothetical protein